jgi:muramidase (phage lysozyme)
MQTCIRFAESTDRYRIPGGAYQFLPATWTAATGLPGDAGTYPPAVQDAAFLSWFDGGRRRHQWPNTYAACRAQLGGPA